MRWRCDYGALYSVLETLDHQAERRRAVKLLMASWVAYGEPTVASPCLLPQVATSETAPPAQVPQVLTPEQVVEEVRSRSWSGQVRQHARLLFRAHLAKEVMSEHSSQRVEPEPDHDSHLEWSDRQWKENVRKESQEKLVQIYAGLLEQVAIVEKVLAEHSG